VAKSSFFSATGATPTNYQTIQSSIDAAESYSQQAQNALASLQGIALLKANNLSGVADVSASRTNLGLGSAATTNATDYLGISQNINGGNF